VQKVEFAPLAVKSPICNRKSLAGNFSQEQATLSIPAAGAPAEEGTVIVQPVVEAEDPPQETVFALPPEEPQAAPACAGTIYNGRCATGKAVVGAGMEFCYRYRDSILHPNDNANKKRYAFHNPNVHCERNPYAVDTNFDKYACNTYPNCFTDCCSDSYGNTTIK
jgi:hypothetical protein